MVTAIAPFAPIHLSTDAPEGIGTHIQIVLQEEQGGVETIVRPETDGPDSTGSNYRLILYNDDWHGIDEVVEQVMKACDCSLPEAMRITEEAHFRGRSVCLRGSRERCHKGARILREIRLQCEVDCD